jgi:DNA-binding PadR family transcriptional regulator
MRRKPNELVPFECAVLEAATALQQAGVSAFYGYALAKEIKTLSGAGVRAAHGTLYRALHRLEAAGLAESFWEDAAKAERERRPRRRMYRLTALAATALARARAKQRPGARLRSLERRLEPS